MYAELEDVVQCNAVASCTVDMLSTRLEGCVYDPEDNDLLGWFKDCKRDYKPLKGSVLMHKYCRIITGLLLDHTWHHPKICKRAKYVDSLQDALKSSKAGSLTAMEKVLIAAQAGLEEAAKEAGICGQVWWVTEAKQAKAK